MQDKINILIIGDIVGKPGRYAVKKVLPDFIEENEINFVIANGENSAHGIGITRKITEEFLVSGIDVLTSGNHIFKVKETLNFITEFSDRLLRPGNFPPALPGKGVTVIEKDEIRFCVINLHGRVFIREDYDCPFRTVDEILSEFKDKADIFIVDFHAEATSEKAAFGRYLDGRVHAVVGTHTHVQTADEKILNKGTAFITDIGMTGPHDSIIGMREDEILERFLLQNLTRFEVAKGDIKLQGVIITIDKESKKVLEIKRISVNV